MICSESPTQSHQPPVGRSLSLSLSLLPVGALRIAAHLQISSFYCGEALKKTKGQARNNLVCKAQAGSQLCTSATLNRTPPTPGLAGRRLPAGLGHLRPGPEPGTTGAPPTPGPALWARRLRLLGSRGSQGHTLPPTCRGPATSGLQECGQLMSTL